MKPNLIVFGASGELGHIVLIQAVQTGRYNVIGTYLHHEPAPVEGVTLLLKCDLMDSAAVVQLVATVQGNQSIPLYAINCAVSPQSHQTEIGIIESTVRSNLNVVDAVSLFKGRCVLMSTDLVFGGNPPQASGYVEADEVEPLLEYGQAKYQMERAVQQRIAAGADAIIVRTSLILTLMPPPPLLLLGRVFHWLDSIFQSTDVFELFTDEYRCMVFADELAQGLVELCRHDVDAIRDCRGVLHVAGPQRCTRYELACLWKQVRGVDFFNVHGATQPAELSAKRPKDTTMNCEKAYSLLEGLVRFHSPVDKLTPLIESSRRGDSNEYRWNADLIETIRQQQTAATVHNA